MLESPYRRLTDRVRASLSRKRPLSGNSRIQPCDGSLLVAGVMKGNSKLSGVFTLLRTGRWEGNVEASSAVVAGRVDGNLTVTGKLEIRKSARIDGSVRAHTVAIADGAIVEGDLQTTSDQPVIRFKERRGKESLNSWSERIRMAARYGTKSLLFRI